MGFFDTLGGIAKEVGKGMVEKIKLMKMVNVCQTDNW